MSTIFVSASPHIKTSNSVSKIMLDVIIALAPAGVVGIIYFGINAALLIAVCVGACVLAEHISSKLLKLPFSINDLSAVVTGLLLAYSLPPAFPLWMAALGSVFAIVVVKMLFGGIGQNFANPAATARIFLLVSFPIQMTTFHKAFDTVTTATPLVTKNSSYIDLLTGVGGGSIGEVCRIALLIGGIYLIVRKIILPIIPLCFIGSVFFFAYIFGQDPLYHILSGGLILGAFFMATDYVTSPITNKGKVIFGICCGFITALIRTYASLPEGVSYTILLMNILTPLIERFTVPTPFGVTKGIKK